MGRKSQTAFSQHWFQSDYHPYTLPALKRLYSGLNLAEQQHETSIQKKVSALNSGHTVFTILYHCHTSYELRKVQQHHRNHFTNSNRKAVNSCVLQKGHLLHYEIPEQYLPEEAFSSGCPGEEVSADCFISFVSKTSWYTMGQSLCNIGRAKQQLDIHLLSQGGCSGPRVL